jgi:hypothetical protein
LAYLSYLAARLTETISVKQGRVVLHHRLGAGQVVLIRFPAVSPSVGRNGSSAKFDNRTSLVGVLGSRDILEGRGIVASLQCGVEVVFE